MSKEEERAATVRLVFLGSSRKKVLFDKLCRAAQKYERHAAYMDMHYLTVPFQEESVIVELNDPGLARTGGREIAVREADMAIIFYSEASMSSFDILAELPALFSLKKQACPALVICDTDDDTAESYSSGYDSDSGGAEGRMRRRGSMEQMRKVDEGKVDRAKGEQFASELGSLTRLVRLSVDDLTMPLQLINDLLEEKKKRTTTNKSIIKAFSFGGKKRNKSESSGSSMDKTKRGSSRSSMDKMRANTSAASLSLPSPSADSTGARQSTRDKNAPSKACVVM